MSLVRFGEDDSDVYVFDTAEDRYECCGCELSDKPGIGSFRADGAAMLEHVAKHRAVGQVVPEYVDAEIRNPT